MPTQKIPPENASTDDDVPATRIFELLANRRRRTILYYLTSQVGAATVGDLADQIALREGDHTRDRYERICISLVHNHLPKLVDADIVRYDPKRETVELQDSITRITPHLDLVASADRR